MPTSVNGESKTGVLDFLSDLVGAAADVVKTVAGKRQAGGAPTYVPQTGIDPGLLRIAVIGLVALIVWKIIKG